MMKEVSKVQLKPELDQIKNLQSCIGKHLVSVQTGGALGESIALNFDDEPSGESLEERIKFLFADFLKDDHKLFERRIEKDPEQSVGGISEQAAIFAQITLMLIRMGELDSYMRLAHLVSLIAPRLEIDDCESIQRNTGE